MRGYLGHWDWGKLGPSKAYPYQEKGAFFMKKVFKIIWGFKHFIFHNSYTPPEAKLYSLSNGYLNF
jgi:hypothetical protein